MLASRKILSSDIITGLLYTRVLSSSSLLRSYSVARVHIFVLKDKLIQCTMKKEKMEIIIQLLINSLLNTKLTFIHTTVYEYLYVKLSEITRRSP